MADESVKSVLNTFAGYETSHESPPFSINDAKDVTANVISVTAAIQDPKYHVNPIKQVILLRRFTKAHNVDNVKDSYLEKIHFTQYETTDVLLKHHLWFLKLQDAKQQQIQQRLALHCKVPKDESSNLERNMIPQPAYEALDTMLFCYVSLYHCQYPW